MKYMILLVIVVMLYFVYKVVDKLLNFIIDNFFSRTEKTLCRKVLKQTKNKEKTCKI